MLRTSLSSIPSRAGARISSAFNSTSKRTTNFHSINTRSSPSQFFSSRVLNSQTFAQRTFFSRTASNFRPPTTNFAFTFTSHARPTTNSKTILQQLRNSIRNFSSSRTRRNGKPTSPNPTANLGSPGSATHPDPDTLSGRMRRLTREYGWSVVGVYLALSALDFPFCYLLVRIVGTDIIGEWEHYIVSNVKRLIPDSVKQTWRDWRASMKKAEREITGTDEISGHVEMAGWGVEEASEANKKDASLATQLALAYAIHKSFIFIRVPLTAAVTPKVVKILRGWGWDIGKRTTKEAKALKRAANPPKRSKR